ncbi:MAG: N-6 DNA methylase [Selenomonadaceae bacterium]|nr:N-6 DNA methylase [Selenomonadaceae bacterium]
MSSPKKTQSVEPQVAHLVNTWLDSYGVDYKMEQAPFQNLALDNALSEYASKSGNKGGNRPDVKMLLYDEENLQYYPVLIEYKGYKDKLVKLDEAGQVANQKADHTPNYANIKDYAVNGAIHYANAILHYTEYTDVIAIGVTGWRDESNKLVTKIGVYHVSGKNLGMGQEVGAYSDLSFLKPRNFAEFTERVRHLSLPEAERERRQASREEEIKASLMKLNNDIYQNEPGLGATERIYLVVASIMATLGVPGLVSPLTKEQLTSSTEKGNTDGDIMMRKVENFLAERNLPASKQKSITNILENTIKNDNINRVENGQTQLKRVFCKIFDDIGIYYKIVLTTDFTGMLFNEMYNWIPFTKDQNNDVVLTPPYVARLMVRLARTNKDSYVWDNATGSAGLLVAAMHEMIRDAKEKITSPEELRRKEIAIRTQQLLGVEILGEIYMLAVLNMILMGDGSSKILNKNSLLDYPERHKFPATVFVLNPPYSAPGNGMIFVKNALAKMTHGYAAVIIQNSAGSGKAISYNQEILKHSTLEASIKMPLDLFIGKSSVQTNIYVFKVGEPHHKDSPVKFIDFSNDGYKRTNRKKARNNLKDEDHAKERYDELVNLVRFGKSHLRYFTEQDYYEGTINPAKGDDWNQSAPLDRRPKLDDFKKTVSDYLAWEVSNILKRGGKEGSLGKMMPHSMSG